jgi:polyisoprenoid-binding protein YceI
LRANIDAASIDTDDKSRDAHLRSADLLNVLHYRTITFKSTRIERADDENEFRIHGDLSVRGTTRDVVLDTSFNGRGKNPYGKEVAGFTAETTLNRRDFCLNWNATLESGRLLVGDKVNVLIEIQAVKQE